MKHQISETGIIDLIRNPFSIKSWIEQDHGLTSHRSDQLYKLLYKTVDDISVLPENEGKYVAYVAIRWGFAEISENQLSPTKIWNNRQEYDEHGRLIKKGSGKSGI